MELNKRDVKSLEFTFDGRAVSARKLCFGDAFSIVSNEGEISHAEAAKIIANCLIFTDTSKPVFDSADEVLDKDADVMMELFNSICAYSLTKFEEAEKN